MGNSKKMFILPEHYDLKKDEYRLLIDLDGIFLVTDEIVDGVKIFFVEHEGQRTKNYPTYNEAHFNGLALLTLDEADEHLEMTRDQDFLGRLHCDEHMEKLWEAK